MQIIDKLSDTVMITQVQLCKPQIWVKLGSSQTNAYGLYEDYLKKKKNLRKEFKPNKIRNVK